MIDNRETAKKNLAQIKELEALLSHKAEDLKARSHLLLLYFIWQPSWFEKLLQKLLGKDRLITKATGRLHFHAKWVIENAPTSYAAKELRMLLLDQRSPKFYRECKQLWLKILTQNPIDGRLLQNAAAFCAQSDADIAESFLLQALELEPENSEYAEELDYVQAQRGNDRKRMFQNRIRYAQRMIAEAPTPGAVAGFAKLREEFEEKLEKLSLE